MPHPTRTYLTEHYQTCSYHTLPHHSLLWFFVIIGFKPRIAIVVYNHTLPHHTLPNLNAPNLTKSEPTQANPACPNLSSNLFKGCDHKTSESWTIISNSFSRSCLFENFFNHRNRDVFIIKNVYCKL